MVDFPLPDGPINAKSSPSRQEKSTASRIGPACRSWTWRPLFSGMTASDPAREDVGDAERRKRQYEQQRRHDTGRTVVEGLHAVVDRDGDRLGFARDAAPDHQHHAELPERMRECQYESGDDARPSQRQIDLPKDMPGRQSGAGGSFADVGRDRLEA